MHLFNRYCKIFGSLKCEKGPEFGNYQGNLGEFRVTKCSFSGLYQSSRKIRYDKISILSSTALDPGCCCKSPRNFDTLFEDFSYQ